MHATWLWPPTHRCVLTEERSRWSPWHLLTRDAVLMTTYSAVASKVTIARHHTAMITNTYVVVCASSINADVHILRLVRHTPGMVPVSIAVCV